MIIPYYREMEVRRFFETGSTRPVGKDTNFNDYTPSSVIQPHPQPRPHPKLQNNSQVSKASVIIGDILLRFAITLATSTVVGKYGQYRPTTL